MVPAGSRRISRVPRYSGAGWPPPLHFAYGAVTLYGRAFLRVPLWIGFGTGAGPTTPGAALTPPRFGLLRVRSPLLAQSLLFSFPPGIEMFQFPGLASRFAERHALRAGLPHSDIRGSKGICPSPRLFAACHVLLRLREPRHPSCALLSFPFFLLGKVAFFRACTAVMTALRASFTEGLFALEFCLVARIYFLDLRALAQSPALVLQCVFAVFTASSMSMYSFPRVENNGFEPLTPCLQSRCSSQLS